MLDLSRHYLEIDDLYRTVSGMQITKLNVLHLHFTDSESFPFQLLNEPEVTFYGAYSEKQTYK